jgi:Aerotolerance regulator N-terminal
MQFTHPIFLWALAGLSVPIAIHLLSRKEGMVIKMGSLRHLQETSTQQFKGIKLNEIVLLVLRCLLILLFVFLLSGLHWKNESNKRWVIVEKGAEQNTNAAKFIDSLKAQGFEMHWLQKNFPSEETIVEKANVNYWQLMEELEKLKLERAVVFSQSRLENFKGSRQAIDSAIQWITLPTKPNDFIVEAVQTPNQFLIRRGHSQADVTSFETQQIKTVPDSIEPKPPSIYRVAILSEPEFDNDKRIVKAALNAIAKTLFVTINVVEESADKLSPADWIINLTNKQIFKADTAKLIFYQLNQSNQLIEQVGKNQWAFTKHLTVEAARNENLSLQLASIMLNEKEKWKQVAHQDRRVLPDSILLNEKKTTTMEAKASALPTTLNRPLLLLFLLILLIERVLAYKRNQ